MNVPRVVSIVLALAAVSMLATGTLGFTSVSAERGVSVNVVDSEDAYVGVTACAPQNSNGASSSANASSGQGVGNTEVYVSVRNRYSRDITVERITEAAGDAQEEPSSHIGPGARKTYNLDFNATEITVEIVGDGFDATVTADVNESRPNNCNPGQEAS
ncbi:hypothetical protein [Halobacterium sp. KA-6]|uniref:hypothetical protein n=1 Tax=Halobacterium sp. KA-6 TaxID=2896368 RepID=UPI001E4CCD7D|nr:hypothetical protein [Halobacterium sp. KA-6]MCD2203016.1 hypothetical protein [Halobacterium sp. KA-6]